MIQSTLGRLSAGENLSMDEMSSVIDAVMRGEWSDVEIGLLLTALRAKGETVDEIAGAATAMRRHMTPIRSRHANLLDTCGPGGTRSETFNISTTTAIVTAAAGVPVAKHGNRSVTSKSGSADVLAALGVNVEASVEKVEECLDSLGLCFCFAPLLHPSMKRVATVRKKLGVRTIFNLLGPLSNPAGASFQLMGVGIPELQLCLAEALAKLGTRRALVVTGQDRLADVSIAAPTDVIDVSDTALREFTWNPKDFGLETAPIDTLLVDGPESSAAMIREILSGKPGPPRDIIVLNTAAALFTVGVSPEPVECARRAAEAIDSGAAADLLARLVEKSQ